MLHEYPLYVHTSFFLKLRGVKRFVAIFLTVYNK